MFLIKVYQVTMKGPIVYFEKSREQHKSDVEITRLGLYLKGYQKQKSFTEYFELFKKKVKQKKQKKTKQKRGE